MTKTTTIGAMHRYATQSMPVMGGMFTVGGAPFVRDFEFRSLEFIWDLFFVIWNFHYTANFLIISRTIALIQETGIP